MVFLAVLICLRSRNKTEKTIELEVSKLLTGAVEAHLRNVRMWSNRMCLASSSVWKQMTCWHMTTWTWSHEHGGGSKASITQRTTAGTTTRTTAWRSARSVHLKEYLFNSSQSNSPITAHRHCVSPARIHQLQTQVLVEEFNQVCWSKENINLCSEGANAALNKLLFNNPHSYLCRNCSIAIG